MRGTALEKFCDVFDVRSLGSDSYSVDDDSGDDDDLDEPLSSDSPAPSHSSAEGFGKFDTLHLCLANWDVAALAPTESPQICNATSRLRALAAGLGLLMDQVYVWRPAPETLDKLRLALAHGRRSDARRLLNESFSCFKRPLLEKAVAEPLPDLSFPEIFGEFMGCARCQPL